MTSEREKLMSAVQGILDAGSDLQKITPRVLDAAEPVINNGYKILLHKLQGYNPLRMLKKTFGFAQSNEEYIAVPLHFALSLDKNTRDLKLTVSSQYSWTRQSPEFPTHYLWEMAGTYITRATYTIPRQPGQNISLSCLGRTGDGTEKPSTVLQFKPSEFRNNGVTQIAGVRLARYITSVANSPTPNQVIMPRL